VQKHLTAILVHGLGVGPSWWNPLRPALEQAGLAAHAIRLPPLDATGPEAWCDEVCARIGDQPAIMIGHSLGAAVCMEAARLKPITGLVLLACPPFLSDFRPEPPPNTGLSPAAIARMERFLRTACANAPQITTTSVHFVGSSDPWVPVEQARRLPFPLTVVPGAGHDLNRSAGFARQLVQRLRAFHGE
jgi:pimeloyl-ACP methyl ester carboxylesterase